MAVPLSLIIRMMRFVLTGKLRPDRIAFQSENGNSIQFDVIHSFHEFLQVRDFKFMCPDDTVFDQENFICANWFEIDCLSSTFYYDKNLQLFQPMDPESSADNSTGFSNVTEMPTELQLRQQQEQLFQLKILEDKQQEQVMKQQQIIELHELRQQEHQRNQFQIIAKQQQDQEDQRIEDQDGIKYIYFKIIPIINFPVAEWSALPTGQLNDPVTNPFKV